MMTFLLTSGKIHLKNSLIVLVDCDDTLAKE
jgi:hypothetical protein